MPPRTSPQTTLDVINRAQSTMSTAGLIAESIGVSRSTIEALLHRHAPVAETLSQFRRDMFVGGWQWLYADTLAWIQDRGASLKSSERYQASLVMAIATDKVLTLHGLPTQITAELHSHRVSFSDLADKLGKVARALPTSTSGSGRSPEVIDARP